MIDNTVKLIHGTLTLELLKEKVVWVKEKKSILIADLHFGKAAHFRKSGIPIPEPIHDSDLFALSDLFERLKPKSVYFLGDIFHSDWNDQWTILNDFLSEFKTISFHLVLGNHDVLSDSFYSYSCFIIHPKPIYLDLLLLSHEPENQIEEGILNICGHIHPGMKMRAKARQSLRFPCFYLRKGQLILPAFGHFTGLAMVKPKKDEKIFAITPDRVIPFPTA